MDFVCKQQQCTPIIHYKGEIYNRISVIDMTIKLGPSTNPITKIFRAELQLCKQQHTPTAIKMCFHVSLNISNTLVDLYMKLHKNVDFDGLMCTHLFTCF